MSETIVLVTNDDGVASPGLAALARAVLASSRRRAVVVAPSSDQSGTSASVAPDPGGVHVEPVTIPGLDEDLRVLAVDGPPALAVLAARLGQLGGAAASATVVASGVNLGQNTGATLLFSGTVGAALAASALGLSGLAVSIDSFRPTHLATATTVAAAALDWVIEAPAGTVLNVNVPDRPIHGLAGVRHAPLAGFGAFQAVVHEPGPGPFVAKLQAVEWNPEPGTDAALLRDGWVTVTGIVGVRATADLEVASVIERALARAA